MEQKRKTLLNSNYVKVDVIGDDVEIYSLSGEFIKISKEDLHKLCKNYLESELYTIRSNKKLDSMM